MSFSPDSTERCESNRWVPPSLTAAERKKKKRRRRRMWEKSGWFKWWRNFAINFRKLWQPECLAGNCYPDLLQVVEVVAHSDWDLTGCVALIWFIISINTQHLHCRPPPEENKQITSVRINTDTQFQMIYEQKHTGTQQTLGFWMVSTAASNSAKWGKQLQVVTWTECWLSEAGTRLTANKSQGCHPSADPLRNLHEWRTGKEMTSDYVCYFVSTHHKLCMRPGADRVYRRRGTTPLGSRSPELSQCALTVSGQRQVVSCSGWPSFNCK